MAPRNPTPTSGKPLSVDATGTATRMGDLAERVVAAIRSHAHDFAHVQNLPQFIVRWSHTTRRAMPDKNGVRKLQETYPPRFSKSKLWEIHIHPAVTDMHQVIVLALAGVARILGPDTKFGKDYGQIADNLGLEQGLAYPGARGTSWRTPVAAPKGADAIRRMADALGPFPIGALEVLPDEQSAEAIEKRAAARMLPASCPACHRKFRLTATDLREGLQFCGGKRSAKHEPASIAQVIENPNPALAGTAPAPDATEAKAS